MIRFLAPAVLVLAMTTATAAADPLQTYAYISNVDVTNSGGDFSRDHCTFTVQVPRAKLDQAPHGASPELLTGATTAHDYLSLSTAAEFDCNDIEHTWQLVTLDPHHKDRVTITFPPGRPDWPQRIIFLVLGLIVLSYSFEKLTGKSVSLVSLPLKYSEWRSDRRIARRKERLTRILDQRIPRAQVVETKHDDPPGD